MQDLQKNPTSDFEKIINARPSGHVLAVCLHPALDVTVYTENGKETHRSQFLGGKAINLARMLHALGAEVTLFAPDDCNHETSTMLRNCGFDCELISTNLSLRRNYKFIDASGETYEQNGSAGTISPQDFTQLIHRVIKLCRIRHFSHVALCGSFPQGVENHVYKSLIEQLNALNISCVTDATKAALSLAIQAKPLLIKPNLQEFCDTFAQNISMLKTEQDVSDAIFAAYRSTGVQVLCSMDKKGAVYAGCEGIFTVKSPVVLHVQSFAGAGDTMLAAFLYARMLCGICVTHALRFATATATAKVRLPADTLPTAQQIFADWNQTEIRKGGT